MRLLERVRDVVRPLVTGRFCGHKEDMAHTHVLSVITGPAANYMRAAMRIALVEASPSEDEASPSDHCQI
jgi:hypothetical protein